MFWFVHVEWMWCFGYSSRQECKAKWNNKKKIKVALSRVKSFEHVDSWAKSLLLRTHYLWNSTTELILICNHSISDQYFTSVLIPNLKFKSWMDSKYSDTLYYFELRLYFSKKLKAVPLWVAQKVTWRSNINRNKLFKGDVNM